MLGYFSTTYRHPAGNGAKHDWIDYAEADNGEKPYQV